MRVESRSNTQNPADIQSSWVLALTLNPALDRVVHIPSLQIGQKNIAKDVAVFLAGKGVNVARSLSLQNISAGTVGFIGSAEYDLFRSELEKQGVASDFIPVAGITRSNYKIILEDTGKDTEINEPGFLVSIDLLAMLIKKLANILPGKKFLSLSGSIPPGVHANIYRDIIQLAREKNVPTLLDSSGLPLYQAVESIPTILKINQSEFEELTGQKFLESAGMARAMKALCLRGIQKVVITMGNKGAIICDGHTCCLAEPPPVDVINPIGAGDVVTAGIIAGEIGGFSLEEQISWAVASATASVTNGQPGFFELEAARSIQSRVTIQLVESA